MKMKDSGVEWIGEIPEEWKVEKISQLFQQRNVKVSDFDYPPLSVTKNGIVPQLESAAKSDDHTNRKLVKKNDFVINSRSDRKMSSGVSNLDGSVSLINLVMSYNHEKLNSRFVNYMMKNYGFAEEFYRWGTGIVADLWSTNWERGKNIQLPVPKVVEQQKIADFLDSKIALIDQIIADTKHSIEELKAYKQSLITETVTKGLDPNVPMKDSGVEWIGEIPERWSVLPLKYSVTFDDDKITQSEIDDNPKIRYVEIGSTTLSDGIKEYQEYLLQDAPSRARKRVKVGDIIISTVRTYLKAIATIHDDKNVVVSTGFAVLRPKKNIISGFLSYAVKSDSFTENVVANSYGISYPAITTAEMIALPIAIPKSLLEQKKIVEFLDEKIDSIDSIISGKVRVVAEFESYKKSLIYEYVTGKKQVN